MNRTYAVSIMMASALMLLASSARAGNCGACDKSNAKCTQLASSMQKGCMGRAEKYKARAEKRAAKLKNADKANARIQKRYDTMVKKCESQKGLNDKWCATKLGRCERKCGRRGAQKAAAPAPKKRRAKKVVSKRAKTKAVKKVVKKKAPVKRKVKTADKTK